MHVYSKYIYLNLKLCISYFKYHILYFFTWYMQFIQIQMHRKYNFLKKQFSVGSNREIIIF